MKKSHVCTIYTVIMCILISCFQWGGAICADSIDVYDDNNFIEEHKDELSEYNNEFQDDVEEKDILIWTYPFSDESINEITDSFANLDFKYLYMDKSENEHLWGYIDDGDITGWICFNEPSNQDLWKIKKDDITTSRVPAPEKDTKEQNVVVLVIILVLVLVLGTGIIIAKVLKKKE